MRTAVALVVVLCLAAVAAAGVPRMALAHDELVATTPIDGAVVATGPGEVTAEFSGSVSLPPSAIQVLDPAGDDVTIGDPAIEDGGLVRAALPPGLAEGTYTVTWRVVSADSHPIAGSFVFSVGAPSAAAPAPEYTGAGTGWELLAGVTRFVAYVAGLFAAGATAFLIWIHDRVAHERRMFQRAVSIGALIAAITVLPGMAAEVAILTGGGFDALTDGESWQFVFESSYGAAGLVTAASGLVLAAVMWKRGRPTWLAVAAVAWLLAAFSVTGHSRTSDPGWLVLPANLIHTGAIAFWFGGLVLLVATLWRRRDERRLAGDVIARFSKAALFSVIVVAATGTVFGWAQLRSFTEIYESRYGQVLAVKVAIFLGVVAIAAWNNRRLVPRVQAGDRGAARLLMRAAAAETLGLVLVAAVTAYLVNQPPPAGGHAGHTAGGSAHSGHELPPAYEGAVGNFDYRVEIVDGVVGPNTVRVTLANADGTPAEVESASIELSLPSRDVAPIERPLVDRGAGRFTTSIDLGLPGDWELTLNVRASEFDEFRTSTTVEIGR